MRVLVTGGAGFIGSPVADAVPAGGDVIEIVDNLTGAAQYVRPDAPIHRIGIDDPQLADVLERFKPAAVIHLAAQIDVRRSVADPAADAATNVLGTIKLARLCRSFGVEQTIFASSGAVYGGSASLPYRETTPTDPESPYGAAKRSAELYLGCVAAPMRVASLRFANVYGPRQSPGGEAGVVSIFGSNLLRGKRPIVFGDGMQTRDFVYVEDVVRAILSSLDRAVSGTYNIGSNTETAIGSLLSLSAQLLGTSIEPTFAPRRVGEPLRACLDSTLAGAHLGWAARVPLRIGIARTIEWLRGWPRGNAGGKIPA